MSAFVLLLLQLLPYLPAVIHLAEQIHPFPGKGAEKLNTAVGLLGAVVPEVITHLQAEPANLPKLQSALGTIVAGLNAANSWNQARQVPAVPAPVQPPTPPAASG